MKKKSKIKKSLAQPKTSPIKKTNKTKKKIPSRPKISPKTCSYGVTDKDFILALEQISKKLVYKFRFGYHDIEDMKQQAAVFALEGLKKYDNSRPLANFLWTHVRNRLFNYKRDNYQRPDKPCLSCPLYDALCKNSTSQCLSFENKTNCSLYANWQHRNEDKKNIMKPTNIEQEVVGKDHSVLDDTANKELVFLIGQNLPLKYRETYIRLQHNSKVSRVELNQFSTYIKDKLNISEDKNNG